MSIIYDALKKTQKRFEGKTQPAQTASPPPSSSAVSPATQGIPPISASPVKKQMLPVAAIIVISFFGVCAVLFFAKAMFNRLTSVAPTTPPQIASTPEEIPEPSEDLQPAMEPVQPAQPERTQPPLVLNGIIYTDSDQLVLINNEIYRTGEFVEGKKIIRITPDKVELSSDGAIEVLKTK